jgi:hypothetical protein
MKPAMSLRLSALLLALLAGGLAPPVRAAEPCPTIDGQFSGANPIFRSGQELPREGTFQLALQPAGLVDYLVGSHRVRGDTGYGGVVTLRKLWPGRYRIFLSGTADLEVIQNYAALPMVECRGEETSWLVAVGEGTVVLQVRDGAADQIGIAFLKVEAPKRP